MLLIVHQCFLMTLSCKIIVFKLTLQTTNKFFLFKAANLETFCHLFAVKVFPFIFFILQLLNIIYSCNTVQNHIPVRDEWPGWAHHCLAVRHGPSSRGVGALTESPAAPRRSDLASSHPSSSQSAPCDSVNLVLTTTNTLHLITFVWELFFYK